MRCTSILVLSLLGLMSFCLGATPQLKRNAILADMLKRGNQHGQKLEGRAIRTPWT